MMRATNMRSINGRQPGRVSDIYVQGIGSKKRAELQTNDEADPLDSLTKGQRKKIKKQQKAAKEKARRQMEEQNQDQAQQVAGDLSQGQLRQQAALAEKMREQLGGRAPGSGQQTYRQKLASIIENYQNAGQMEQEEDDGVQFRSANGRRRQGGFTQQQQQNRLRARQDQQKRAAYISSLNNEQVNIPVLKKEAVDSIATFRGLIKARPSYNLNQQGYLQSFPQWIMGQQKRLTNRQSKGSAIIGINRGISDQQDGLFATLSAMDKSLATWDSNINKWVGTVPKQIDGKMNNTVKNLTKKMADGDELLETNASRTQIVNEIPTIVQQLVLYNQNLSKVGFGPISQNGLGLYAGRWLDPATGNVRVLPPAKSKYINPASLPQKLGYLQAKILNNWNTFVASYEQYMRYSQMDQDKYRQRVAKGIKNGLDLGGLIIKYNNAINKIILNYTIYTKNPELPSNMTEQILKFIGLQKLINLYKASGDVQDTASARADNSLIQLLSRKQSQWEMYVTQAQQTLLNQIAVSTAQQSRKDKLIADLNRTALRLIAGPGRSIANSLKKAGKILAIPDDLTENDLMRVAKTVDDLQESDNKLTSLMGRGYSQRNIGQLAEAGQKLQQGIINKNLDMADSMLRQAKVTALQGKSSTWALKAPKAPSLTTIRRNVLQNAPTMNLLQRLREEQQDRARKAQQQQQLLQQQAQQQALQQAQQQQQL